MLYFYQYTVAYCCYLIFYYVLNFATVEMLIREAVVKDKCQRKPVIVP